MLAVTVFLWEEEICQLGNAFAFKTWHPHRNARAKSLKKFRLWCQLHVALKWDCDATFKLTLLEALLQRHLRAEVMLWRHCKLMLFTCPSSVHIFTLFSKRGQISNLEPRNSETEISGYREVASDSRGPRFESRHRQQSAITADCSRKDKI